MYIFTKKFWSYAGERAIKTFAQTGIALLGVSVGGELAGFADFDWVYMGSAVGVATILSILTSLSTYDPSVVVDVKVPLV